MILVTREVQDYVLFYQYKEIFYEIHLIDSPGFDDDITGDVDILSNIAEYVNTTYKLKERLAGVLYLHDITKARMGGVGKRNIRMLEKMIGVEKFKYCTILTTKWGCTNDPNGEKLRENTIRTDPEFFGSMLGAQSFETHATFSRFDPRSRSRALEIIRPYLRTKFTPQISQEMVDPKGPKLTLGETRAGRVVADNVEKLAKLQVETEKLQAAKAVLSQKYDESLFAEFKEKRNRLRRKIRLQRSGRWIIRTTIVGGAIAATVLTLGPGASAFVLEPVYEKAVRGQKREERKAKADLETDFKKRSQDANRLKTTDPHWLWDSKVKNLHDLDEGGAYSLRSSSSSDDILAIAKKGETVGMVVEENDEDVIPMGKGIHSDTDSIVSDDEDDIDDDDDDDDDGGGDRA